WYQLDAVPLDQERHRRASGRYELFAAGGLLSADLAAVLCRHAASGPLLANPPTAGLVAPWDQVRILTTGVGGSHGDEQTVTEQAVTEQAVTEQAAATDAGLGIAAPR